MNGQSRIVRFLFWLLHMIPYVIYTCGIIEGHAKQVPVFCSTIKQRIQNPICIFYNIIYICECEFSFYRVQEYMCDAPHDRARGTSYIARDMLGRGCASTPRCSANRPKHTYIQYI